MTQLEHETAEWPIFAKVDGRIIPWMSVKGAIVLGVALLLAFFINHELSSLTYVAEVAKTGDEMALDLERLVVARDALALDETESELASLSAPDGSPRVDLAEEELERFYDLTAREALLRRRVSGLLSSELIAARELADDYGITGLTGDEELSALVPTEKQVARRVVSQPVCLILLAFFVIATAAFVLEPTEGRTLAGYFISLRRFSASQHEYLYRRSTGSAFSGPEE